MSKVLTTTQPNSEGFELRSNNAGTFIARVETVTPDWIADAYTDALAVSDWYLDAVTGNDQNDGITPATALQSGAELQRRLGPQPGWRANVTVHVLENGITDALQIIGSTLVGGVSVNIVGTPTLIADAGTISAYTAMDHVTPRSPTLTCTGVTDWTPYVGKRVRITSGTNTGAVTWVLKANPNALGLNVARTGAWYKKLDLAPATQMYAAVTPVVGDTVSVESLPPMGGLDLRLSGAVAAAGGNGWTQRQAVVDSVAPESFLREFSSDISAYRNLVFGCRFTNFDSRSRFTRGALNSQDNVSCLFWTSTNANVFASGVFAGLCTQNVLQFVAQNTGIMSLYFSVLQGTQLSGLNGFVSWENVQVFDVSGSSNPALRSSQNMTRISSCSGNGNAGYGILVANQSRFYIGGTNNLTGTVANVYLSTATAIALPASFTLTQLATCPDFAWSGQVTLVAGTANVTVPYVVWTSQRVMIQRANAGGTIGNLTVATATRTTTQFTITSDSASDTSTVEWSITPLGRAIVGATL